MKTFKDTFLESLKQVYEKNPADLDFKKYFALELYKRGEYIESFPMLVSIIETDNDINVAKAINDIKSRMAEDETIIGFVEQEELKTEEEKLAEITKPKQKISFADVAGMENVKDAIRTDIIYPFQHPEIYKQYRDQAGGGILLFGPPGCGKTYIAKAAAGEIDATFISVHIHDIISAFIGTGEQALHDTFEYARANKPAVLFFDEIDAVGANRTKTAGVLRTLVNQFLTELDGIDSENDEILVIGATNLPWEVDQALRRPGRFNKVIFVPPPDVIARTQIFETTLRNKPTENIDYEKLADLTKKYSAADITQICAEAAEKAFKRAVKTGVTVKITQQMVEAQIAERKSTVIDWFNTAKNYVEYSNESGLLNAVKKYLEESKDD
jgi:transitional endoplasmic reticulum ATPase